MITAWFWPQVFDELAIPIPISHTIYGNSLVCRVRKVEQAYEEWLQEILGSI